MSHRTLVIRVDAGAQPLTGQLTDDDGASRTFVGWIGLLSSLEQAIETHAGPRPSECEGA